MILKINLGSKHGKENLIWRSRVLCCVPSVCLRTSKSTSLSNFDKLGQDLLTTSEIKVPMMLSCDLASGCNVF